MKTLGGTIMCAALVLFVSVVGMAPASADTSVRITTNPDLHPGIKRARLLRGRMEIQSIRVQTWLAAARGKKQRLRARCLSYRLSQLHAYGRLADRDVKLMTAAVRNGDPIHTIFPRFANYYYSAKRLYASADRCGKRYSKRVRMKTQYTVKVYKPRLPKR